MSTDDIVKTQAEKPKSKKRVVVYTTQGPRLQDAIRHWLNKHHVTFLTATEQWQFLDAPTCGSKGLAAVIRYEGDLDLGYEADGTKAEQPPRDVLETACEILTHRYFNMACQELGSDILAKTGDDSALREWLATFLIESTSQADLDMHLVVFKQFLWNIKRRIADLPDYHHVMPIIWGGQGGGKTKNLESLMAPLGSFFRTASVTELQGQFDYKLRTNCFGVLFDELSGIEKVDSNTLKDTISGVMVGGRKMYSADAVGQARRANFIACTNSAPPHGLKDSTGARRFWSMPARGGNPSKARMDFFNDPQRIAAIWGCIDVGAEQYYGPLTDNVELMHAVRRRQDELLRTHSTLEAFLEAETVKDPEGRMSLKEFAAYYHQWANSFGRHIASPEDFRQTRLEQALTHLGYSIIKPNNRAVVKGLSLAHDDEIG